MTRRTDMPAARRFKVPGSMIRTNLPTAQANHTMLPGDRGAIIGAAGITIFLPAYQNGLQGEDYIVPNHSGAVGSVSASQNADGSPGHIKRPLDGALVTSVDVPAGDSFTFTIETDGLAWIIT